MNLRNLAGAIIIFACTRAASAGAPAMPPPVTSETPAPSASVSPVPTISPSPPPVPSPPVPPRDAAGINVTTPPIVPQSPNPTPTVPDALWFAPGETSSIPIDIHNGVVFIPVVADGRRRTFLLDTRVGTAVDGSLVGVPMAPAWVLGTLQIGDVRLTNLLVSPQRILPYSQTYLGAAADGAIGMDVLSKFPVTIDYANRRLTIYHTSAAAEAAARPAGAATLTLGSAGGVPAATARVSGKFDGTFALGTFALDTLATTEVVVSDGFARAHRFSMDNGWIDIAWLARPSGEIAGRMGRIASLTLGPLDLVRPITVAASPTDASALPHSADGALGAWLLQRFTVTLDVPGATLVLAPAGRTSMATAAFDRSGAWLVQRAGYVEVRSVLPGSPASEARLHDGDQLLALNGHQLSTLDDARAAFSGALGTSIAVRFHRGIFTHTTTLTLHTVM